MRKLLVVASVISLCGRAAFGQDGSEYRIPLHGVATIAFTRKHDSLFVAASSPASSITYRCERPLTIARRWAEVSADTVVLTPGSGKGTNSFSCGLAIRELRDTDTKGIPAHCLEVAMDIFHLVVPLTNEETSTLAALLKEATR